MLVLTKRRLWSIPVAFAAMLLGGLGMDLGGSPLLIMVALLGALFSLVPFFYWVIERARLKHLLLVLSCLSVMAYCLHEHGFGFTATFMVFPVLGVCCQAFMYGIFQLIAWLDKP